MNENSHDIINGTIYFNINFIYVRMLDLTRFLTTFLTWSKTLENHEFLTFPYERKITLIFFLRKIFILYVKI